MESCYLFEHLWGIVHDRLLFLPAVCEAVQQDNSRLYATFPRLSALHCCQLRDYRRAKVPNSIVRVCCVGIRVYVRAGTLDLWAAGLVVPVVVRTVGCGP